jgi:hypothetical protein
MWSQSKTEDLQDRPDRFVAHFETPTKVVSICLD